MAHMPLLPATVMTMVIITLHAEVLMAEAITGILLMGKVLALTTVARMGKLAQCGFNTGTTTDETNY